MKPVLIIQNDANEGAGYLLTLMQQRGFAEQTMLGWEADYATIKIDDYAGLIVLGGAQGVYETDTYPYLIDEIKLTKAFMAVDKPVIGICLGGQILATALGGEVKQNSAKEIGWFDIKLSDEAKVDALMKQHPAEAIAYHFHGDYFSLPPECVGLASSAMTACQLFRFKDNVYGFQFHAEVDQPLVEIMCLSNIDYMRDNGYDADQVIAQSKQEIEAYQLRCENILNSWLDKVDA